MTEQTTPDRWFLSDVDGRMEIWREAVLLDVTRDENGEIDSYRTPVTWAPGDLILYRDLETWNEGEDAGDDARRAVAARMVSDHNGVERVRYRHRPKVVEVADDLTGETTEITVCLECDALRELLNDERPEILYPCPTIRDLDKAEAGR